MANVYNRGKLELTNGGTTWTSSTIVCILVSASYTYNPDNNFISDLTNELTNPGYTRQTLGGKVGPTEDDTNDRVRYTASSVLFASLGAGSTPAAMILARSTGVDSTSPLIAYIPLTTPPAPNGGDYTIDLASLTNGVIQLNDS